MKFTQLFLLAMCLLPKIQAQDADLDKFYFKTQEIHFPKNYLPSEKRTYAFKGSNGDNVNFNENDAIKLGGFTKDSLQGDNSCFVYFVMMNPLHGLLIDWPDLNAAA
jgi:hypothetical protein